MPEHDLFMKHWDVDHLGGDDREKVSRLATTWYLQQRRAERLRERLEHLQSYLEALVEGCEFSEAEARNAVREASRTMEIDDDELGLLDADGKATLEHRQS